MVGGLCHGKRFKRPFDPVVTQHAGNNALRALVLAPRTWLKRYLLVSAGDPFWRWIMTEYNAPVRDMLFVLNEVLDLHGHYQKLGLEEANNELINAVLEDGAKFA